MSRSDYFALGGATHRCWPPRIFISAIRATSSSCQDTDAVVTLFDKNARLFPREQRVRHARYRSCHLVAEGGRDDISRVAIRDNPEPDIADNMAALGYARCANPARRATSNVLTVGERCATTPAMPTRRLLGLLVRLLSAGLGMVSRIIRPERHVLLQRRNRIHPDDGPPQHHHRRQARLRRSGSAAINGLAGQVAPTRKRIAEGHRPGLRPVAVPRVKGSDGAHEEHSHRRSSPLVAAVCAHTTACRRTGSAWRHGTSPFRWRTPRNSSMRPASRGFGLEFRKEFRPKTTVGILGSWEVFHERRNGLDRAQGSAAITGVAGPLHTNSFPIMLGPAPLLRRNASGRQPYIGASPLAASC